MATSASLLLAVERWNGGTLGAPPSGWSAVETSGRRRVSSRVAGVAEPASYTWTNSEGGWSRTGGIVAVRGGTTLADSGVAASLVVPSLTAAADGSLLVGMSTASLSGGSIDEQYSAGAPLVESTEHTGDGSRAYVLALASAIATEEGVAAGAVSGRAFSHPAFVDPVTFGVVVGPS